MTPFDRMKEALRDEEMDALRDEANMLASLNGGDFYLTLLVLLHNRRREQLADMSADISPYQKLMMA